MRADSHVWKGQHGRRCRSGSNEHLTCPAWGGTGHRSAVSGAWGVISRALGEGVEGRVVCLVLAACPYSACVQKLVVRCGREEKELALRQVNYSYISLQLCLNIVLNVKLERTYENVC